MISPTAIRLVGAVLVALSLLGVGLSAYETSQGVRDRARLERYVECQAAYNEADNVRARVLTEAVDQERDATRVADDAERKLFTDPALGKPTGDRTAAEQKRLRDLFAAYQLALTTLERERVEADKTRTEHPVPPPPSSICRLDEP